MAKLLVEHRKRRHAHCLARLHTALAHRRWRDRLAHQLVAKLLVADATIAVGVACAHEQVQLRFVDWHVPEVEGARDLLLVEAAGAVEVHVLEGLVHVGEVRVDARLRLVDEGLELLGLLELLIGSQFYSRRLVVCRRRIVLRLADKRLTGSCSWQHVRHSLRPRGRGRLVQLVQPL